MPAKRLSQGMTWRRCENCVCGIENAEGIWCAVRKRIPRPHEVRRCRRYCPRRIIEGGREEESA